MTPNNNDIDRKELLTLINKHFSEGELRDLCFYLDIDFEDLGGGRKSDKARELILLLVRKNRINDLFIQGADLRPEINWQKIPKGKIFINARAGNCSQKKLLFLQHILANIFEVDLEKIVFSEADEYIILKFIDFRRENIEYLSNQNNDVLIKMGIQIRQHSNSSSYENNSHSFSSPIVCNKDYFKNIVEFPIVDWDSDPIDLIISLRKTWPDSFPIQLRFTNREEEKKIILKRIKNLLNIQVIGASGLGKTYILNKISKQVEQGQDYKAIWFDFSGEDRSCAANYHAFLDKFYLRLVGKPIEYSSIDEDMKIKMIARGTAEFKEQIVLFIDNADYADWKLLGSIRNSFLQGLQDQGVTIPTIGSAQKVIPEWIGVAGKAPPFSQLYLSGFSNILIIEEIISDIIEIFGSPRALAIKQQSDNETWKNRIHILSFEILRISRGHPLAIAELINYIHRNDGFVNEHFCSNNQNQIIDRVLSPIVGGRILPKIEGSKHVRQAFKSLCVFRYLWPGLIRKVCKTQGIENETNNWRAFSETERTIDYWWTVIQDTLLIQEVTDRAMYPISSIERQIIASVLKVENLDLFQKRNAYAKNIYKDMVYSENINPISRASYFVELLFHLAQEDIDNPDLILETVNEFKTIYNETSIENIEMFGLLHQWLRSDQELRDTLNNHQLFEEIVDSFN